MWCMFACIWFENVRRASTSIFPVGRARRWSESFAHAGLYAEVQVPGLVGIPKLEKTPAGLPNIRAIVLCAGGPLFCHGRVSFSGIYVDGGDWTDGHLVLIALRPLPLQQQP